MEKPDFTRLTGSDVEGYTSEQAAVLNFVHERPEFSALPPVLQDFIQQLDGLELNEQLQLIHDFTAGMVAYVEPANQQTDIPMTFMQVLAAQQGDCDDQAIFEAGLLQYAVEQGILNADDVLIVGGQVTYSFMDPTSQAGFSEATINHNFVIVEAGDQSYYLDQNSGRISPMNENGFMEIELSDQNGNPISASAGIDNVEVIQSSASHEVWLAPNIKVEGVNAEAAPTADVAKVDPAITQYSPM